jgi:hypothetical protein
VPARPFLEFPRITRTRSRRFATLAARPFLGPRAGQIDNALVRRPARQHRTSWDAGMIATTSRFMRILLMFAGGVVRAEERPS